MMDPTAQYYQYREYFRVMEESLPRWVELRKRGWAKIEAGAPFKALLPCTREEFDMVTAFEQARAWIDNDCSPPPFSWRPGVCYRFYKAT